MPYVVKLDQERFRRELDIRGLTIKGFAKDAEVHRTVVFRALSGQTVNPKLIAACAALFGEELLPCIFVFTHTDDSDSDAA